MAIQGTLYRENKVQTVGLSRPENTVREYGIFDFGKLTKVDDPAPILRQPADSAREYRPSVEQHS